MNQYFLLLPLLLLLSCSRSDRQDISLGDTTIERPADGIGHYVFAASLPVSVAPGEKIDAQMEWRTVGPVDPTARYALEVILTGPAERIYSVRENENTVGEYHLSNWFNHDFLVPADFPAGEYRMGVRLRDKDNEIVELGHKPERRMATEGFYHLGSVRVE